MTMNKYISMAAAAVAALAVASPIAADAQVVVPAGQNQPYYPTGIGPAISGSVTTGRLPRKATDFLNANFPQSVIKEVEEEFDNGTFEVDFTDGTDIEFDSSGEWTEVDAGHSKSLPQEIVKKLLPSQAYKEIGRLSLDRCVETVKRSGRGYKVEFPGTDIHDLFFDPSGTLVAVEI